MAKTIKEERLRWVLPVVRGEITLKSAATVFPHSKRTLERWVGNYKQGGEEALAPKSTTPKTHQNETSIRVKEEIIAKRNETGKCAQKLHWELKKEGLIVPVRTIGKILSDEGLVRRYRTTKRKYTYVKAKLRPGELLELDVKWVPGPIRGRRYYQYTAVDRSSRWRYLQIHEGQTTYHSVRFLQEVIRRAPFSIRAIKTDNHSTFTNYYVGTNKRSDQTVKRLHALDRFCARQGITHYLIDPGKPAQNGTVERSHREDEEKLYQVHTFHSVEELRYRVRLWNLYYNDLEHCSLNGLTPNEFLSNALP